MLAEPVRVKRELLRKLGHLAAFRAGRFELVMTAEEAGAYKPDPLPYRMALERLGLDPAEVLFVAGSAHDVGGAARQLDEVSNGSLVG